MICFCSHGYIFFSHQKAQPVLVFTGCTKSSFLVPCSFLVWRHKRQFEPIKPYQNKTRRGGAHRHHHHHHTWCEDEAAICQSLTMLTQSYQHVGEQIGLKHHLAAKLSLASAHTHKHTSALRRTLSQTTHTAKRTHLYRQGESFVEINVSISVIT